MDSTLNSIVHGLEAARSKIATTRQALQAAPTDAPEIQRAIARLERLEAELIRIDGVVTERASAATLHSSRD